MKDDPERISKGDLKKMKLFGLYQAPTKPNQRIVDAGGQLRKAIEGSAQIKDIDRNALATFFDCQDDLMKRLVFPSTPDQIIKEMTIPTLQSASVYPLVEELLEDHRLNPRTGKLKIREARACALPYGAAEAKPFPNRPLHYFADWFVNAVWGAGGGLPAESWAKSSGEDRFRCALRAADAGSDRRSSRVRGRKDARRSSQGSLELRRGSRQAQI